MGKKKRMIRKLRAQVLRLRCHCLALEDEYADAVREVCQLSDSVWSLGRAAAVIEEVDLRPKILMTRANNKRRAIEIMVSGGDAFALPYSELRLRPSKSNRIVEIYTDDEFGNEAITYSLESGEEDSIHLDAFLAHAKWELPKEDAV
jgi:hypothetical protein